MKILNLYAGIGGNRKLWGNEHDITAVEKDPEIASIYKDYFHGDNVIIGDAHQYLLEHFTEFDFIWASPPCPTHSRIRYQFGVKCKHTSKPVYPDMKLYQEIIFLQHHFEGKWVVENVISYYDPLIKPQQVGRHYFWANFTISKGSIVRKHKIEGRSRRDVLEFEAIYGYNLEKYNLNVKRSISLLRNCVNPELGKHILECSVNNIF